MCGVVVNRLNWFMTHALNACVPCVHTIAVSTLGRHPIDNSLAAVDKFSPEWQRCARHVLTLTFYVLPPFRN